MVLPTPKSKRKPTHAHRRASTQESEGAARFGGRVTPASGAKDKKGDIQVKGIARIECKTTTKNSFSVTREMVDKIAKAGMGSAEIPVILIEFLDKTGKPESELAVIPSHLLDYLVDVLKTQ